MKLKSVFAGSVFCLVWLSTTVMAQLTFDRPKNTKPLPTPYTINVTRQQVLDAAREILSVCKMPLREKGEGATANGEKLVTEYIAFARGVTSQSDLTHYTNPRAADVQSFVAGRVSLEILALPLDEKRSQIQIAARFQAKRGGVSGNDPSPWIDCPSNGQLEDEILRGLAGKILGIDLSIDRDGRRRILTCEY